MPTSPFHNDGAMIPDEQQPNKSSVGQQSSSLFHRRVSAQNDDVTGPLGAKCLAEVQNPKSLEKTETGMPGRKDKHTEKGPRVPASRACAALPLCEGAKLRGEGGLEGA